MAQSSDNPVWQINKIDIQPGLRLWQRIESDNN